MGTINPSLDQATLLTFEKNFYKLAQQKDTKLLNTPAIKFMDIKGISNVSRMGQTDLVEVTGQKIPEKQYTQMSNDNRKSKARRFTRTFVVDSYDKAVNMITDPTSDLFGELNNAKARETDRVIIGAAAGDVVIGGPQEAGTSLSAADDGVITIAGTANFNYSGIVAPAIRNYINNDVDISAGGVTFAVTGSEHESLMTDDKYINAFYTKNNVIDKGKIDNVSGFNLVKFAGSDNGVISVKNPILPELNGIRKNIIMAPKAIGFAMEVGRLEAEKSAKYVNAWEITIDVWFKALRLEGKLVQIVTSTI